MFVKWFQLVKSVCHSVLNHGATLYPPILTEVSLANSFVGNRSLNRLTAALKDFCSFLVRYPVPFVL